MNNNIKISVSIPIYGVEKYIEASLRSVFGQTMSKGVEYILVNDCTKDNSMEIVQRVIKDFPTHNITIIEHEKNGGLAVARQTAMDAARGEYIIHFDSDDLCEPTMLEEMYNYAVEQNADIVTCDYFLTTPSQEWQVSQEFKSTRGEDYVQEFLCDRLQAYLWCKLIKRSLFVENDIKWLPGVNMWEDTFICLRLFCYAKKVVYLPKAYLHYLQIAGSISDYSGDIKKTENELSVISYIEQFYIERGFEEKFRQSLITKKIRTKMDALYKSRGAVQQRFAKLYPEIEGHIDNATHIPAYFRTALKMANNGSLFLFNLIVDAKKLRSKFIFKKNGRF